MILAKDPTQAVAILVKVKRCTANQQGYSGPCFERGVLAEDDPATEVIVAISRYQCSEHSRKTTHTRAQFPLMLAW